MSALPPRALERLSVPAARRIAVAAQGLAEPRPTGRIDRRHLRRVLDRINIIQIDSVNVLVRSQELPLFARLGPHPRTLITEATDAGELFEYWSHAACHIPTRDHRLYRWKMERNSGGPQWTAVARLLESHPDFLDEMLERVRREGPLVAGDVSTRVGPKGTWWDWDDGKHALEYLFWIGRITARRRTNDFARRYDLPERMIPAEHLNVPTPTEHEARKELLMLAARAFGVGTEADLADYHRQKPTVVRPLLRELVEDGALVPVQVDGWERVAFLHPEARRPRRVQARALLSPFDPMVWNRDRNERLFGFHYRIEIYVPQPQRRYGYYVLPFLLGDRIVGRVDLKADRQRGALLAPGVYAEEHADVEEVAPHLAAELVLMAGWLGLDRVEVGSRGELATPVARAIASGHLPPHPLGR